MALTGDFHRLARLRQQLEAISRGGLQKQCATAFANETVKLMVDEFNQQRDPYGKPWAPRKRPPDWAIRAFGLMQDDHRLLDKSGKMIDSLRAKPLANGNVKVTMRPYAQFHQTGTDKMVARKLVPDDAMDLGPIWGRAFNRVADDILRGMLST